MKTKIVVISDLHFSHQENALLPNRVGRFANIFLLKVVHRLNRWIKPDLVFVAGDLINDFNGPDAMTLLEELKQIINLVDAPVIVIPGNHDPAPDTFYKIFERPAEFIDIGGVRFLPFIDEEQPGYNAIRSQHDLARMSQLAGAFYGPVVSLQHVPLFPTGAVKSPYNYTNSDEIMNVMRKSGVVLAISGHYHTGYQVVESGGIQSVTAPACCEDPFQFLEIEIDSTGHAKSQKYRLKLPDKLPPLTDFHIHTHLAYCGENMDMTKTLELSQITGLDKISFTEHACQLYVSRKDYGQSVYCYNGLEKNKIANRTNDFFTALKNTQGDFFSGLELDVDINGNFTAIKNDIDQVDIKIGAVHSLHMNDYSDCNVVKNQFMHLTEQALKGGVDILAHPFRVFRRSALPVFRELYLPLAKLLRASDTAAEINFHTNDPDPEFFLCCIKNGVKLSLGSDSHNLYEIGELQPHLNIIEKIGYLDRFQEIMYNND